MVNSIIQKSQLESVHRLDAEYYQQEYLKLRLLLEKAPTLSNLFTGMIRNPMAYGFNYETHGIPYYRIDDLLNPFLNDNPVYISSEIDQKLRKTQLKYGDLIMAVRGATIGRLGLYLSKMPGNISPNVIILRPKDPSLSKYYSMFLISKLGRTQIEWMLAGTGQPTITTNQLAQLKIVREAKVINEVEKIFDDATQEYNLSRNLYKEAENLLFGELWLNDFQVEDDLSFVVNLSDIQSANRIDAEYFQPKYEKLIEKIKDKNLRVLTSVIQNVDARFNPYTKPDTTFKYVELANINSSIGIIDGFSEVLGKEAPSRAKRLLKKGDVIVSSVEGSLEKVALVSAEQNEFLASTGFFQFRSKELLPEALLVLAQSLVLQMQLEKQCAGTILTAVPQDSLKNIVIPILSKSAQQKIAELVRRSHEARKKSKELLEEAKRRVEEMIEKGNA